MLTLTISGLARGGLATSAAGTDPEQPYNLDASPAAVLAAGGGEGLPNERLAEVKKGGVIFHQVRRVDTCAPMFGTDTVVVPAMRSCVHRSKHRNGHHGPFFTTGRLLLDSDIGVAMASNCHGCFAWNPPLPTCRAPRFTARAPTPSSL